MNNGEIPKELLEELSNSEKKLKNLYEKRDYFNEEAKVHREMRDDLNRKKGQLLDELAEYRMKKQELATRIKNAKAKRDTYNQKARQLMGLGRKAAPEDGGPVENVFSLELELKKLEERYVINPVSDLRKERDMVNRIEYLTRRIKELKKEMGPDDGEREEINTDSVEEEIKGYRELADREHGKVESLYREMKDLDERLKEHYYPTLDHLRSESDKRHEEYLKIRKQADSYHRKAVELKERVLQLRSERNRLVNEAEEIILDQNRKVRERLDDEVALDDAADRAVELLLKNKKVEL